MNKPVVCTTENEILETIKLEREFVIAPTVTKLIFRGNVTNCKLKLKFTQF